MPGILSTSRRVHARRRPVTRRCRTSLRWRDAKDPATPAASPTTTPSVPKYNYLLIFSDNIWSLVLFKKLWKYYLFCSDMFYHRMYFKYIIIILPFSQFFLNKMNGQTCITKIEECLCLGTEGVASSIFGYHPVVATVELPPLLRHIRVHIRSDYSSPAATPPLTLSHLKLVAEPRERPRAYSVSRPRPPRLQPVP
jgi:hypothetical protein